NDKTCRGQPGASWHAPVGTGRGCVEVVAADLLPSAGRSWPEFQATARVIAPADGRVVYEGRTALVGRCQPVAGLYGAERVHSRVQALDGGFAIAMAPGAAMSSMPRVGSASDVLPLFTSMRPPAAVRPDRRRTRPQNAPKANPAAIDSPSSRHRSRASWPTCVGASIALVVRAWDQTTGGSAMSFGRRPLLMREVCLAALWPSLASRSPGACLECAHDGTADGDRPPESRAP